MATLSDTLHGPTGKGAHTRTINPHFLHITHDQSKLTGINHYLDKYRIPCSNPSSVKGYIWSSIRS